MGKAGKRVIVSVFVALFILSVSFVYSSNQKMGRVEAASYQMGTVNAPTPLNVRAAANAGAKILGSYKKGTKVQCLTVGTTWVKVRVAGKTGYANGKYIDTAYGTATQPYKNIRAGYVIADSLTVRKTASAYSAKLTEVKEGTKIQVLSKNATWVKVKANGKVGYASGKYIRCGNTTAAGTALPGNPSTSNSSVKGQQIIEYAKKFLGNRYVYGGTSLTNGTDCSGFTMGVYRYFGYSLPRTSAEQRSSGRSVSSLKAAQPGDLICYSGHVAIYMGNNMIIHASNAKDGIKISYKADYKTILAIRRILK